MLFKNKSKYWGLSRVPDGRIGVVSPVEFRRVSERDPKLAVGPG